MEIKEWLIETLIAADKARSRSQQVEIGPSQVGDCRTQVWLQLQGAQGGNPTLKLPALMGTAIHKAIEEAITRNDPFSQQFELEVEVEADGLKGHVDLYIPESKHIVDWKTTKKKNLDYFPSLQQRWQVQLYGYLMRKNGREVETVSLFVLPRDGDERQIQVHTEPYSEEIAMEALEWLEDLKGRVTQPAPERDAVSWCRFYCEYFGHACSGKEKAVAEGTLINDLDAIRTAHRYKEILSLVKTLEEEKETLKTALEGVSGVTPDYVSISWSEMAGRQTVDEEEVSKLLGYIPKKQGAPSMRLLVK